MIIVARRKIGLTRVGVVVGRMGQVCGQDFLSRLRLRNDHQVPCLPLAMFTWAKPEKKNSRVKLLNYTPKKSITSYIYKKISGVKLLNYTHKKIYYIIYIKNKTKISGVN